MIHNLNEEIDPGLSKEIKRVSRLLSIGFSTSESLAAHVVVYKTLGLDKELAQVCMLELARRRSLGEGYDYEDFIEQKTKEIPQMRGLDLTSLGANLKNFSKIF